MLLICRSAGYSHLSLSRVLVVGLLSLWLERVYVQWFCYTHHLLTAKSHYRVFFTHWGPSADSGHWVLQIHDKTFHIFKEAGYIKARLERPGSNPTPRGIPTLSKALYIPFFQYFHPASSNCSLTNIHQVRPCRPY
jgi:hypothetical protein